LNNFLRFLIKFLVIFLVLYLGTLAIIGLAAPGKYYSPFIEKYFDYVSWIKHSLMKGAAVIAHLFGFNTREEPGFLVRIIGGRGVIIAMDCVGYGVMSFWSAFVIASPGAWKRKIVWLLLGLISLWFINVLRIGIFLVAINKGWGMPLGWDHHTWFNIIAYAFIFLMIWAFDKNIKQRELQPNE